MAFLCSACGTQSENVVLNDTSVASLGKAATVLIVNNISAQVTVPKFTFNVPAIVAMGTQVATPEISREELVQVLWTKVFQNPEAYLQASPGDSETKSAVAVGSGFFVTSDGVLVTNAHVVEADGDELKKEFASDGLKDKLPDIIKEGFGTLNEEDRQYASEWLNNDANGKLALQGIIAFLAPRTDVTDARADLGVADVSGQAGTLERPQLMHAHTLPRGVGSSKDEDVALLKVDGVGFHTIPLAVDEPQIEESVFAVGFPGDSTFSATFDQKERPESTVTDGKVNAIKAMSNYAYSAIQMSATIHPGNSGGPVLDHFGRVVGISTFGLRDAEGHEISGTNFAIPISVAKRFLNQAGVTAAESDTTLHYRRALMMEQVNHFSKARAELESVLRDRPTDAIALREMERVKRAISDGQDRTYMDYAPAGGVGLACILLAGVGAAGLRRRRRTVRQAYRPLDVSATTSYRLLIQGKMIPLAQGSSLTSSELPFLKSAGAGSVATVVPNSNPSGTVGIRNDSSDSWEATRPDGSSQIVAPFEVVPLVAGLRISFGPAQGVVHG
jgi:serine protease Do